MRGVKHKVHQGQRKQIDSHSQDMFKMSRHWYEHKHASVLAIGQLRHQSVTPPCLATRATE